VRSVAVDAQISCFDSWIDWTCKATTMIDASSTFH
jgi:hypothetical protein